MIKRALTYPASVALAAVEGRPTNVLADPLTRNGLALVSSAALSSILGLIFWILAARLYAAEVVGLNAVMISSMITLANLSQLNLGNFLTRTLAGTGSSAGRIVLISYVVATASGAVFALAFIFGSRWLVPELSNLFSAPWLAAGYAICIIVWTIFNLQDSVLSGLRQSVWVPVENGLFSIAKILFLIAFSGSRLESFGPFLAWMLPTVLLIPAVNMLVAFYFVPQMARLATIQLPKVREIAGMMGWDYLATTVMMIGLGVAPILVLKLAGPSAAAGYSIAWAIAYSIYLVARSFGISMMAEAAADPPLRKSLAARSLISVAALLLLAAFGVVVLAPYFLLVFGRGYTGDNVNLLRLLVLSAVPWGLTTIYVSVARSAGRTGRIAAIQIATVSLFFLAAALSVPAHGVVGVGIAWLVAHSFVLIAICIIEAIQDPTRVRETLLISLCTLASLKGMMARRDRDAISPLTSSETSSAALVLGQPKENLVARRVATFANDCQTIKISATGGAACLYLKRASTTGGRAALDHHVETVMRLRRDIDGLPEARLLPQILADEDASDRFIIQQCAPGVGARSFLPGRPDRCKLLSQSASAMTAIHASSARKVLITKVWLEQWVDEPLSSIATLPRHRFSSKRADAALDVIRTSQHAYWEGRQVRVGWAHGDLSPGNLFFDTGPAESGPHVSAIIDWDGAAEDGPASLDAWHLALTAESQRRGTELGQVVSELLWRQGPPFDFRPDRDLAADEDASPPVAVLAWLRHVDSNLKKSPRYRQNLLWRAANIDWVLDGFLRAGT